MSALVLWDKDCGFCRRSVQWLERRDAEHKLELVPFQEAPSPPMTPALYQACQKAAHVLTPDGRALRAGRAALYILAELGHPTWAAILAWPPFIWAIELGYFLIARNRKLFSRFMFTRE
jgi:predicted DCC family thiol-disulfide oxidoreductase YuxK